MTRLREGVYDAVIQDFPIKVTVFANGFGQAVVVVSDAMLVVNGAVASQLQPTPPPVPTAGSVTYRLDDPRHQLPYSLLQSIHGWFPTGSTGHYDITISPAVGTPFTTSIPAPTINPGITHLTFKFRGAQ